MCMYSILVHDISFKKFFFKGTTGGLKCNTSHSPIKSSSFTPRLCVPLNLYTNTYGNETVFLGDGEDCNFNAQ